MNLTDVQLTGVFLAPIALIGVIANWTVFFAFLKWEAFNHSFGFLSANQSFADAINSSLFLLYYCPMVIFEFEFLLTNIKHIGFLLMFCYELSIITHLFISLNRFFAVFTPLTYKSMFSKTTTKCVIVFIWVISCTENIINTEVICNLEYNTITGFLFFTDSPLCVQLEWYLDYCKNTTIIITIMVIDIITVIKIRASIGENTSSRISKQEINFLKQTVFQGVIFTMELTTYFMLPPYLTSKWAIFFSTSFAWVSVHACDGVVTMVCNPEFKQYFGTCGGSGDAYKVKQTEGSTTNVEN